VGAILDLQVRGHGPDATAIAARCGGRLHRAATGDCPGSAGS
jgi:hypothetical protein